MSWEWPGAVESPDLLTRGGGQLGAGPPVPLASDPQGACQGLGRAGTRGTDSCSGCRCSRAHLYPGVPETPV